jgi:GH15 family glucan-1,4-alpha-glucosidase
VCDQGYDEKRGTFTQYYGSTELDAAVLLIPEVGFLPPGDPRVVSTVETIQRELTSGGLVLRYTQPGATSQASPTDVDGLTGGEGAFLACSFWLVNALHLIDHYDEAEKLFDRLLSLRNDVGLLAEEYDPRYSRQVGNFPQAFSHMPLIQSALNLGEHAGHHCRRPARKTSPAP